MFDPRLDKWLVLQVVFFLLVIVSGPFTLLRLPLWIKFSGGILLILSFIIFSLSFSQLGSNLTPFVYPHEEGSLVTSGIYSIVRHPMYSGLLLFAFGWSMLWGTWLGIIFSVILFLILDRKANREEELLTEKYPRYANYKAYVKKFIPFIY